MSRYISRMIIRSFGVIRVSCVNIVTYINSTNKILLSVKNNAYTVLTVRYFIKGIIARKYVAISKKNPTTKNRFQKIKIIQKMASN